jgi:integration host factor subunit beta
VGQFRVANSGESLDAKTKESKLTRADLIDKVSESLQIPYKEAAVIVELILDGIVRALGRGEKVEIRGFGSFRTRLRRSRIGRNPMTGARVEIPPKKIPYFKPSKELRELVQRIASAVT